MIGVQISNDKKIQIQEIKKVRVINYSELSAPPPIEKIYVPPPPTEKVVVQQKKKIEKYVAPVVVQEEVVEPEEEMMTMEEIRELISSTGDSFGDSEGVETVVVVVTPPEQAIVVGDYKDPEFPGGKEALMKWLDNHLKYPSVAQRMGVEGKVVVEFIVDENGKISEAEIKESLHRLCDREALRLINSMPDWIPGEKNGVKTLIKYTLSVPFILE
jgi:protein TonB